MNEDVRELLIKIAKQGETITYRELGRRTGIWYRGKLIGKILGEISEDEVANGHPPLSSIVVLEESIGYIVCPKGHPARGFLLCSFTPRGLKDDLEAMRYMKAKQEETWDWWKKHDP